MKALVLDSSYFPVKIVGWQKAMILIFSGRAEIVSLYESQSVRSTTQDYKLPKVLRLFNRHRFQRQVKFSRENVFIRDQFQCQYCKAVLPTNKLTLDHVVPTSKGGKHTWSNVVTACNSCNVTKGNKLLKDTHFKLLKVPKTPSWGTQWYLKITKNDPKEWLDWLPNHV